MVQYSALIASQTHRLRFADEYTPSQLVMISHDRLAQFWEGFGHISYFQRVDVDALMKYGL